jgi:hypothetical protein
MDEMKSDDAWERPGWKSTGARIEVPAGRLPGVPPFDPRTGSHLWTWVALYRASPTAELPMLDVENLLTVEGIGCYYCEDVYSPRLASRRCKGKP